MAICASALTIRVSISGSFSRTSSSPAATLSPVFTGTSAIRPASGAAIRISPDTGSTRPGATACQFFSSAGRATPSAWTACTLAAPSANAMPATTRPTRGALSPFAPTMKCKLHLASCIASRVSLLFTDDEPIFDANDPVGERQYTRIMRNDQNRAGWILGDRSQDRHDGVTVLAVQCGSRLVGKNSRSIPGDRASNGNALLLTATHLDRKRLQLVSKPNYRQRLFRSHRRLPRTHRANIEDQADVFRSGERRKQMVGLKNKSDMLAPEPGELLGPKSLRRMSAHANRSTCGCQYATKDRKQSGLAAARGPHQECQLATRKRQTYALESRHAPCPAAEKFYDIDGLDHAPR